MRRSNKTIATKHSLPKKDKAKRQKRFKSKRPRMKPEKTKPLNEERVAELIESMKENEASGE